MSKTISMSVALLFVAIALPSGIARADTIRLHCDRPAAPFGYALTVDLVAAQLVVVWDNPNFHDYGYSASARITEGGIAWDWPQNTVQLTGVAASNVLNRYTLMIDELDTDRILPNPGKQSSWHYACSKQERQL